MIPHSSCLIRKLVFCFSLLLCGGPPACSQDPPSKPQPAITDLLWTSDGTALLVARANRVEVCEWPSLHVRRKIELPLDQVFDVQLVDDESAFLCAGGRPGESGTVAKLHLKSGRTIWQQSVGEDVAYEVANDASGLYAALHDHSIVVLNAQSGRRQATWSGHSKPVVTVLSLNAETVLTASLDQTIRVREAASGNIIRSLSNHTQPVTCLARRPGTAGLPMVASTGEDRTLRFWQPTIGRLVRFQRLPAVANCVVFDADGRNAYCGGRDGNVYAVAVDTLQTQTIGEVTSTWINAVALHPQEEAGVAGDADGRLTTFARPQFPSPEDN